MTEQTIILIAIVITAALIPLAPKLLRLRIYVLRKVHLKWLADFHERNFKVLVVIMRSIWVMIIVALLWIAANGALESRGGGFNQRGIMLDLSRQSSQQESSSFLSGD